MQLSIPLIKLPFSSDLSIYSILFSLIIIFSLFIFIKRINFTSIKPENGFYVIFAILFLSNLIHGYKSGFLDTPIRNYEGLKDISMIDFLSSYERYQNMGLQDSENYVRYTHPVGEVILMYSLHFILLNHGLMSFIIGFFSSIITYITFLHLLEHFCIDKKVSLLFSICLISLPAIQIHYIASTDAIVSSLLLLILYYFTSKTIIYL
ncbi:hypothetical protein Ctha_2403 [Chloroherpeton thalassium ATCC 35110]|uniref:Uncharacterized protein n=1 Tax=Chloroherpeton thalassium (strain ATCC 35110 / GB-78) TaxID=517418 RepID=B3QX43_CHLT3|nr:hypothetical protein [Chloroherpeton thalassium]ACF14853.1 hypothetical protein Ctha_2403 [Chloroherpeton thalassium ATCC 35110]